MWNSERTSPGTGEGVTCSNYISSWMGKAHFQGLSRFVLIGASLISVENDVETDSVLAWCVGRVEIGSLLSPEANFELIGLEQP